MLCMPVVSERVFLFSSTRFFLQLTVKTFMRPNCVCINHVIFDIFLLVLASFKHSFILSFSDELYQIYRMRIKKISTTFLKLRIFRHSNSFVNVAESRSPYYKIYRPMLLCRFKFEHVKIWFKNEVFAKSLNRLKVFNEFAVPSSSKNIYQAIALSHTAAVHFLNHPSLRTTS